MNNITMIASGLIIGLLIWLFKEILSNQLKAKVQAITSLEGSVNDKEMFNPKKLVEGLSSLVRGDLWGKTLANELSLRTWMVRLALLGIIIGVIYGYGVWKGRQSTPVKFEINYEQEMTIPIPKDARAFYKPKNSSIAYWILEDGTKRQIVVKDIPQLAKALKPYGFMLEPVLVAGLGAGNQSIGFEGGVGVRYAKYFKWLADVCITNKGFYPIGVSYRITENSAIGISSGFGFKEGERSLFGRIIGKFTVKF